MDARRFWKAHGCAFQKFPSAPRTRRNAAGAKAGCVSFAYFSLHKQRKVSRRKAKRF
jgi:hypothetical protein